MKKIIILGGLIIISILAFLFVTKDNRGQDNYTIGVILPLTGDGASYGLPMKEAVATAVREIQTTGNSELEVVYADGKCTEAGGEAAARELIDAGVTAILGGACSSETLGAARVAEAEKVLLLNGASGSSKIADAGTYIYRIIFSNAEEAKILARHIANNGYETVGLLVEDNAYPLDMRDMLLEQFATLGITVSYVGIVDDDSTNLQEAAEELVNAKTDAVITLPQTPITSEMFALALVRAGIPDTPRYTDDMGIAWPDISVYSALNGYIGPVDEFPGLGTDTYNAFVQETGCTIGIMCAGSYDGVYLLADTMEQCGGSNPKCLKDSFDNLQAWPANFLPPVTFDKNGEIIVPSDHEPLYRVVDGVLIPLTK